VPTHNRPRQILTKTGICRALLYGYSARKPTFTEIYND
jgi:hypothetical protein